MLFGTMDLRLLIFPYALQYHNFASSVVDPLDQSWHITVDNFLGSVFEEKLNL